MTNLSQTWDLSRVFPEWNTDSFPTSFERMKRDLTALVADASTLREAGDQPATWQAFAEKLEHMIARQQDFGSIITCACAENVDNKVARKYQSEMAALSPLFDKAVTEFELALKSLGDTRLNSVLKSSPWLTERAFFFQDSLVNSRFRLPREQQALASELNVDGLDAWGRLYERLSGDLRIQVMERGELVQKSPGQVLFDSMQRSERQNEFFAARKAWKSILTPCAATLNHIAGSRLTLYKHLGVQDHLTLPLHQNRMTRETLECMWAVTNREKQPLLDYMDAKAQLLGLKKLSYYDLEAPLPQLSLSASTEVSYEQASQAVIASFQKVGADTGTFARTAIEKRWLEVENRQGKAAGGFCTSFAGVKESRIFLTYRNNWEGAQTIAHELGHAYHSYVMRDLPTTLQLYPMNLAETASTFGEHLLLESRLNAAKTDPAATVDILSQSLDGAVAFICNIQARFLFEDRVYRKRAAGELEADEMCELMTAAQVEAYGGHLDPEGHYPEFWASKMHFFFTGQSFYNYPYTFGFLLSLGLYDLFQEQGAKFSAVYSDFLRVTGKMTAEDAAKSVLGFDLTKPEFWTRSFSAIKRRVHQFTEAKSKIQRA